MTTQNASVVHLREQTIHLGAGAVEALGADLGNRGWHRVAVLASQSAADAGVVELVSRSLGSDIAVINELIGVAPHSPAADTQALAGRLADSQLDALISVGGGKVSDTAKGISILLASGGQLVDHCTTFRPPADYRAPADATARLPLVAVPTTLSGAEITPGGGTRTETGEKRAFWVKEAAARLVAYDPDVLRRTPPAVLASTGMNALAHCVEGVYSRTASPFSDALAQAGARDLLGTLPLLADADPGQAVFERLGSAAALAGLVISNARTGLHHAVCHVLGARLGLAHGIANAVMLAPVTRFNAARAPGALCQLAAAADPRLHSPEELASAITVTAAALGLQARLRETGLAQDDLQVAARLVMHERGLYFNPEPVPTEAEVFDVLRSAW